MNSLKARFNLIDGGIPEVAKVCGLTVRAIYKWVERNRLPRTEYTGETNYAERIEKATGGAVTAKELLSLNTETEST